MKSKIFRIALCAFTIFAAIGLGTTGSEAVKTGITLYADHAAATKNDIDTEIAAAPIKYKYKVYVPADDVLKLCGFTLGWDPSSNSVVAARDEHVSYIVYGTKTGILWVDEQRYEFDTPPLVYNGTAFISLEMFAKLSDDDIYIVGDPAMIKKDMRDTLQSTYINDNFRLSGTGATYKGITVIGNTGMELLNISDSSAAAYASMVNAVADALPYANIYNIAVPTACEFYAPKSMYTNQTAGIKKIYEQLNSKVTPINVVRPLMEHANEFIYFRTDHHWTQRGAYYAYKEFIEVKGEEVPPLESFQTINSYNHVGSFASFMKGTAGASVMRANPDLLERFMPVYSAEGAAYNDCNMKKYRCSLQIVYPTFNSYSSFIGGDNPLAVFHTSNTNGKKLVVIKESFGTAFSTWAANNYEYIFVIDPRQFNGFNGHNEPFNLKDFYITHRFDDLVIINYPGTISSSAYRSSVLKMLYQ